MSTGLTPAISTSVIDHVTTCPSGYVNVTSNVPRGSAVKVDGKSLKVGRTVSKVRMTPGQRFSIVVGAGRSALGHSIRCLPGNFPKFTAAGTLPVSAPFAALSMPALVGSPLPYAFVIDSHGTPIWWKEVPGDSVLDVKAVSGGRIAFWHGKLVEPGSDGPYSIYRLDGRLDSEVRVTGALGDPHEMLETGRGTWYRIAAMDRDHTDTTLYGGPADRSVHDNEIQEIDSNGNLVWSWKSRDHIAPAESTLWASYLVKAIQPDKPLDLVHMNSIEEDADGNVIVSCRHLDAVYKIRKSDGAILWKLGGSTTAESLTVIGDDANGMHLGGQHDARVLPDGTLTVYDNGSGFANRPARGTRWAIDPAARTATLVETLTDSSVKTSPGAGSVRKLADGSWLASWTGTAAVRAYLPDHKVRFDLKFANNGLSYRANPITTSQITRAQFVAGMDAQYPR